MSRTRLTVAQAIVRFLSRQVGEIDGERLPLFAGVWAIFGHGNVAAMGEALHQLRDVLPTYRAHNEQAMALAAVAFAKASRRRRMMACTSSIGPGATNMITAAAVAHVNRLPVLFLPGDAFANRRPDPVLQQIENFADGTASANDCFRPVSRYFDRISRPEQILPALDQAIAILTDPAACGPVTLALCQDVQAEAFDCPDSFLAERVHRIRRAPPDANELTAAAAALAGAKRPLIIAGGGVLYSGAERLLADFAGRRGIPVAETQAGKSALAHGHPMAVGSLGVTGTAAANHLAKRADLIVAVGTRLADFTTGSWSLFQNPLQGLVCLNVQPFDAVKHGARPLVADARIGLEALDAALGQAHAAQEWVDLIGVCKAEWAATAAAATAPSNAERPTDAQVIGAVQRAAHPSDIVVGAAGGLPGELHKLWNAEQPLGYHLEYGYSTMGYEIAGGLGVKLAAPQRQVIVMVGDGSYLMMNSELATSCLLGQKLIVIVLDNRGFGCIERLQKATGGAAFNNLFETAYHQTLPAIDFVLHARSLGVEAVKVASLAELADALTEARAAPATRVIVIDTDPFASTSAGGHWWDVAVPAVSARAEVRAARSAYEAALTELHGAD
jgi:3D-(3,5/4)-trihydroxycyclohexane-1,2-dione acylhydrolase (decyclizing)